MVQLCAQIVAGEQLVSPCHSLQSHSFTFVGMQDGHTGCSDWGSIPAWAGWLLCAPPDALSPFSTLPSARRLTCVRSIRSFPCSRASSWIWSMGGTLRRSEGRSRVGSGYLFHGAFPTCALSSPCPPAKAITSFEGADSKFQPPPSLFLSER